MFGFEKTPREKVEEKNRKAEEEEKLAVMCKKCEAEKDCGCKADSIAMKASMISNAIIKPAVGTLAAYGIARILGCTPFEIRLCTVFIGLGGGAVVGLLNMLCNIDYERWSGWLSKRFQKKCASKHLKNAQILEV